MVFLTPADRALVRAALLPGAAAADAFAEWTVRCDFDAVTFAQFALLPLLYRNVEKLGIDHPWMPRIAGIYRRTWYANQLLFRELGHVVAALEAAEVRTLVVGAAALTAAVYPDTGARPVPAPTLLVPPASVDVVSARLASLGWRMPRLCPGERHWHEVYVLADDAGKPLELTWHLRPEAPDPAVDADTWGRSHPLPLAQLAAQSPDAASQLLRTCLTAGQVGPVAVADAALLMRSDAVDWPRLVDLTARAKLALYVLEMLDTLRTVAGLQAPAGVGAALEAQPLPAYVRRGHAVDAQPPTARNVMDKVTRHYARFRRMADAQGTGAGPVAALGYLQTALEVERAWEIPLALSTRLLR